MYSNTERIAGTLSLIHNQQGSSMFKRIRTDNDLAEGPYEDRSSEPVSVYKSSAESHDIEGGRTFTNI